MMKYRVIEKFVSIDGEGPSAGEIATFVRFEGCDLRCSWCDTTYSWDGSVEPELLSAAEIRQFAKEAGAYNVTLTGGEPLIQEKIEELISCLLEEDDDGDSFAVRIETHGGVDITPFVEQFSDDRGGDFEWDLQFIVDFKLPDSQMMSEMCLTNLDVVGSWDTVKFVIASVADLDKAIEVMRANELDVRSRVYFSPVVDLIEPSVIVERMVAEKLNHVRLQLQLHKYIWPKEMRGV